MADFEIAYKITSVNEGGYANVKGDRGGETYAGISRVHFPKWEGWKIVDENKPLKWNQYINNPTLKILIKNFYRVNFWNPLNADSIKDQLIANRLYDFGVNCGVGVSIKQIQEIFRIKASGKISKELEIALNNPLKYLLQS